MQKLRETIIVSFNEVLSCYTVSIEDTTKQCVTMELKIMKLNMVFFDWIFKEDSDARRSGIST